jgi:transcriptional regulator with XRE-family HTH domain
MKPEAFAKLRLEAGFTQAELSRELDVTIRSITRWETGETPIPKLAELALRYVIEKRGRRQ